MLKLENTYYPLHRNTRQQSVLILSLSAAVSPQLSCPVARAKTSLHPAPYLPSCHGSCCHPATAPAFVSLY